MFGMGDIIREAKNVQEKMQQLQIDLAQRTVEGSSGGGMVSVTCTCQQELTAIKIDPSLVNPEDVTMLEDMVQAAINDAMRNSKKIAEEASAEIASGLKLPGGLSLPAGFKLPF